MIEIQIAGAGAGKTYGLAERILDRLSKNPTDRKIFALTYTNAAKVKIESEIIKQNGSIPDVLTIETVHSFFLNEIIYPFSSYTIDQIYNDASVIPLSPTPRYKAFAIKRLKDQYIIHAEKVYEVAKQIIDETNSKHTNKKKRARVSHACSLLNTCMDSIFIDEIQDLDSHALRCFEVLGALDISVYMIGDPKQAIKWPKDFDDFIKQCGSGDSCSVKILPANNFSRRVPSEILQQSNRFCYVGQEQKSLRKEKGQVCYIESIDDNYEKFLGKHISKGSIVCIDKKNGDYDTHTSNSSQCLPRSIEDKLKNSIHKGKKDERLFINSVCQEFYDQALNKSTKSAISNLIKSCQLDLDKSEFAQLCEMGNALQSSCKNSKFQIQSIDAVKGLESETCIFVLSQNSLNYFLGNIDESKHFNKEWKKIYVALTRAKKLLILALDHKLLKKQNIASIKDAIENLGIPKFQYE